MSVLIQSNLIIPSNRNHHLNITGFVDIKKGHGLAEL